MSMQCSKLPTIDRHNRGRALILAYLAFSTLYLASGYLHWREPSVLEPWQLDSAVPLLPWSIWVYFSQFLFLFLSVWLFEDNIKRSHTLYAMVLATIIACTVFFIWPTSVARADVSPTGLTGIAWQALYFSDTPANCFPSLHVAFAWLAASAMVQESDFWRCVAPAWAVLISFSTLTTKQHYVVDIMGGIGLAAFCYVAVRHKVGYAWMK